MMKTLFLIRHAKSSWNQPGLSDHNRPLNNRGLRDVPLMAQRIANWDPHPEKIVSSSAVRARLTAEAVADAMGFAASDIVIEPRIYEASVADLLAVIRGLNKEMDCIALVGHNPGFTEVANLLGNCDIDNVPTSGVVVLAFQISEWHSVTPENGQLMAFDYPKKHQG
ncbi:MAG: histidine phosphatase family protein [Chloroflexota bacterium]